MPSIAAGPVSKLIPGELLVKFKPGVGLADIGHFYCDYGLSEREALDRHVRGNAARLKLVSVPATRTTELIPILERDPRVAYAEPNYLITNVAQAAAPTDPFNIQEYHLNNFGQFSGTPDADMDAREAWNITTGSPDVLVAVIDTGVDYNHPDLIANIWTNPFEVAGDGLDNDGNGYIDDIHGIDTISDSGDPMDCQLTFPCGHGTEVSGVIGATPFNEGTVGVAWRVGIVAVKLIKANDTATAADAVKAFHYVNYLKNVQGQNIVATNNSWLDKGLANSQSLKDAMANLDQPGMAPILHVLGAGNQNENNDVRPKYPANYDLDNIISVAATVQNDHYGSFSNYGATSVDLAAAGDLIHTTYLHDGYCFECWGTSMAAPQVTGAAALVWSAFPGLTAAQVKERILAGVDPIGHLGNNWQKPTLTNGRLNVARALAGAAAEQDNQRPAVVRDLMVADASFQSVTLTWTATGDDGSRGRASLYDIRYATTPITSITWETAVRVLGEPGPKLSGAAETFTVTGLDPGTNYYFAFKVRDNMGNESALSDVAQASTAPATTLFSDNMEGGANGWTSSGLWHQSSFRANSPVRSWYYGIEATRNYATGGANSGELTSPPINLRSAVQPVLIFRQWRQIEDVPLAFDFAKVQISTGSNRWDTLHQSPFTTALAPENWQNRAVAVGWNTPFHTELSTPQWVSQAVDLSPYVGQTIRIRFAFDTGIDGLFNNFEGWYVDDVNVFDVGSLAPSGRQPIANARGEPLTLPETWLLTIDRRKALVVAIPALPDLDQRITNLDGTTFGLASSQGIGGGVYVTTGGVFCADNTLITGNRASTPAPLWALFGHDDVFGIIC